MPQKIQKNLISACAVFLLILSASGSGHQPPRNGTAGPSPGSKQTTVLKPSKPISSSLISNPTSVAKSSDQTLEKLTAGDEKPAAKKIKITKKTNRQLIAQDGSVYPLRIYKTAITPNDPAYNQWWVAPNGMTNVWDIPAGTSPVKIAIIDTGFALNHQELINRWAINSGESGPAATENPSDLNCTDQGIALDESCNNIDDDYDGIVDNETGATPKENPSKLNCTDQGVALNKNCNNIDDDNNGLVDDYRGWDFANNDASPQAGEINPSGTGTYHGTMVAGVLGATGNNSVGIAGVNWNAEILPIQSLSDDSYGDSYTVGQAIYYAADQGANIINLSLGTSSTDPYLRAAILYALDKGSIVVAASGNDGCNCITYPANYPEVIAVGAEAPDGSPAGFSNYGAQLDLLAPGQSITTSYFTAANRTGAYATGSGTSFAAPFVSGLIGLAKSSQPDAPWEEIIGAMLENSDRRTLTAASPRNDTLGYGVASAENMLNRLRSAHNETQRYEFSGGTISGSSRSYQCPEGVIPATRYYELKKSGAYRYTSNLRELSRYQQLGWSARSVAYVCIGLPTDTMDTLRTINIPSETLNIHLKQ